MRAACSRNEAPAAVSEAALVVRAKGCTPRSLSRCTSRRLTIDFGNPSRRAYVYAEVQCKRLEETLEELKVGRQTGLRLMVAVDAGAANLPAAGMWLVLDEILRNAEAALGDNPDGWSRSSPGLLDRPLRRCRMLLLEVIDNGQACRANFVQVFHKAIPQCLPEKVKLSVGSGNHSRRLDIRLWRCRTYSGGRLTKDIAMQKRKPASTSSNAPMKWALPSSIPRNFTAGARTRNSSARR